MKVRVRQKSYGCWVTELKRWYWPFWQFAGYSLSEEKALDRARLLKSPKITEIE